MKKIIIKAGNLELDADLIRDEHPRIALSQQRIVLLNKFNVVIAQRDLLCMFTTTEMTDAKTSIEANPKTRKRAPKFMGSGIFMHEQFRPEHLVVGDTCWDADWGDLKWDGVEWKPFEYSILKHWPED